MKGNPAFPIPNINPATGNTATGSMSDRPIICSWPNKFFSMSPSLLEFLSGDIGRMAYRFHVYG
ncbi:hypothetical protein SX4_0124 [Vibrio mimicus SX-4]|nr:hypothetical protein SX4_0124 [Vibrio mimicus SX-4]